METRIVFWDETYFYVEHLFLRDSVVCVRALVDGVVRGPSGILHPNDVFADARFTGAAPSITDEQRVEIEALKSLSGANSQPSAARP